jgi:NOL1/NOP2/sun family putative RNA methylase
MPEFPQPFLHQMEVLLRHEYPNFRASLDLPPISGLRLNPHKTNREEIQNTLGVQLEPIPWCSTGFAYSQNKDFQLGKHPYHAAGLYYLQDPAAMAVAELVNPQPGERILDLAAAPGGKSTHLASMLRNQGTLVANEIHPRRVWALVENLERWGMTNSVIMNEHPDRIVHQLPEFFDRVLVDAPCSGEALFRRSPEARLEWSPEHVQSCALRQSEILNSASALVRPGGYLVYVTCTFNAHENESVVARFLDQNTNFRLIPTNIPGTSAGHPEWATTTTHPELAGAIRIWPHHSPGEGHFIALLQRHSTASAAERRPKAPKQIKIPKEAERLFHEFCAQSLVNFSLPGDLLIEGSYLYTLSSGAEALQGLNRPHPGFWLGTLKKNRFEPSHALALALHPDNSLRSVSLSLEDTRLTGYLRGEITHASGDPGWVLVCANQHPVGWAKRVDNRLKSHFPRGLRKY